jgi:hypothetical protein
MNCNRLAMETSRMVSVEYGQRNFSLDYSCQLRFFSLDSSCQLCFFINLHFIFYASSFRSHLSMRLVRQVQSKVSCIESHLVIKLQTTSRYIN